MDHGVITVIGNCQAELLASCLTVMNQDREVRSVNVGDIKRGKTKLAEVVASSSRVVFQTASKNFLQRVCDAAWMEQKGVLFPTFYFSAFHPDFVYPTGIRSMIGLSHSSICLYAWLKGFSTDEAFNLYRGEAYRALGFTSMWEPSVRATLMDADQAGVDLRAPLEAWRRRGCFVHSPNHPSLYVVAEIARQLAPRLGLKVLVENPDQFMHDPLTTNIVWPVFPEIAEALRVAENPYFKISDGPRPPQLGRNLFDLRTYIERTYAMNMETDRAGVTCAALNDPRFAALDRMRERGAGRGGRASSARNPYRDLPDYRFWRKVVAAPKPADVDPVLPSGLKLTRATRIATGGSCFAQHVARHLKQSGFNFFVTEQADGLPAAEAVRRNFGVYSARFGNLYTARQLVQLFDRSEGAFKPVDDFWLHETRFVDPFRPEIEPDGFESLDELQASRASHLAAVRRMWRELDVFVFTLGLTESWHSTLDGAVFPLAPGVSGEPDDAGKYAFRNFTSEEIAADLAAFRDRLRSVNPAAQIILTVSPVPLIATFEDQHVLVATTYSKSALRVAAEAATRDDAGTHYFPSYEIITGAFNRGAYFAEDLREVTSEGVNHVMRLFLRHYTDLSDNLGSSSTGDSGIPMGYAEARDVICEEELLDPAEGRAP